METQLLLEPSLYVLHVPPSYPMSDDVFYQFALSNRDLRIERNAQGELIIMPPTGGRTGQRNAEITARLLLWSEQDKTGITFDSSTAFRLPNSSIRAPDASWLRRSRWDGLTDEEREKFPPLCPDFVIELRSPTDSLTAVEAKMREYIENGATLGWLIDPEQNRVTVYRSGEPSVELIEPDFVSGDPLLVGFRLDRNEIW